MKINVANPATGQQKMVEVEEPRVLQALYEKRLAQEFDGALLGEEWTGYVVRITGGSDKQGFPLIQGVLTNNRVRLLLKAGSTGYNPRRKGERMRKTVRGCVVSSEVAVLNCTVVAKGEKDIEGLTDKLLVQRLGPKRASKIRKLFKLEKGDDVRRFVTLYSRTLPKRDGKDEKYPRRRTPKIQRLTTPLSLQHKRRRVALRKQRRVRAQEEAASYQKMLHQRMAARKDARKAMHSARRSSKKVAAAATAAK